MLNPSPCEVEKSWENLLFMDNFSLYVPRIPYLHGFKGKSWISNSPSFLIIFKSYMSNIISTFLKEKQEDKILYVLEKHKTALGWSITDIKGISLSFCMHKILIKDNYKPSVEHQT